jgi:peptidoglycan/xylan/chitin deacetylase (PgdA/CDA1 family)
MTSVRTAIVRRVRRAACVTGVPAGGRWLRRHELLILCYHGISPATSGPHATLTPADEFAEQMEFLARNYTVLDVDTALLRLKEGKLSKPTAAITFDDGYQSVATHAHPVLSALGLPYSVYLVTGLVAGTAIPWPLALELCITHSGGGTFEVPGVGSVTLPPGPSSERSSVARRIVENFKRLPAGERREALATLIDPTDHRGLDPEGRFALMDWATINELSRTGLATFGAHTDTHEILSTLSSKEVTREIVESVRVIRDRVSNPSNTFAYPNGRPCDIDERSVAVLKEIGVSAGLTTSYGRATTRSDPHLIPRLVVGGHMHIDDFAMRTAGVWLPYR